MAAPSSVSMGEQTNLCVGRKGSGIHALCIGGAGMEAEWRTIIGWLRVKIIDRSFLRSAGHIGFEIISILGRALPLPEI